MNQNINELVRFVQEFCDQRDWDQFHNPKDLAIGLSTESNELLDIFRFKNVEQMREMMVNTSTREKVSDELGDVFFFLLRFVQMYDFDLSECLQQKIDKNEQKYPVDLSRGQNKKYSEYQD